MDHYIFILLLIILLIIGSNKSKYNNKKKELYNNYQPLMFTEESIILREHFFSKSEVSDTNELKLLYDYLRKIKLSPINITVNMIFHIKGLVYFCQIFHFQLIKKKLFLNHPSDLQ